MLLLNFAVGRVLGDLAVHHLAVMDVMLGWRLHGGVVAVHDLTGFSFSFGFPSPHGSVRLFVASEFICIL